MYSFGTYDMNETKMKKIKICICIIFLATLPSFARYDFDTVRTFKYGFKFSYRFGMYGSYADLSSHNNTLLPSFIWFKKNGNYTELEPLNFALSSATRGNEYTADSVNYSRITQVHYVPKIKFYYKIYQHKNNRIFIGMTHTFRASGKNTKYKGFDWITGSRYDYAFGIDLTFQKSLSDRFILDVSICSYLLKLSLESERRTGYNYNNEVKWMPSLNKFYEDDYNSFISSPVSIQIGLIYSFKKVAK